MLALDPKTGKIKWHYQFSPNNPFDYDLVAEMVLADLSVDGKLIKVLMDADQRLLRGRVAATDQRQTARGESRREGELNWYPT